MSWNMYLEAHFFCIFLYFKVTVSMYNNFSRIKYIGFEKKNVLIINFVEKD